MFKAFKVDANSQGATALYSVQIMGNFQNPKEGSRIGRNCLKLNFFFSTPTASVITLKKKKEEACEEGRIILQCLWLSVFDLWHASCWCDFVHRRWSWSLTLSHTLARLSVSKSLSDCNFIIWVSQAGLRRQNFQHFVTSVHLSRRKLSEPCRGHVRHLAAQRCIAILLVYVRDRWQENEWLQRRRLWRWGRY